MNAILKTHSKRNVNMTLDFVHVDDKRENASQNIQDNKKKEQRRRKNNNRNEITSK